MKLLPSKLMLKHYLTLAMLCVATSGPSATIKIAAVAACSQPMVSQNKCRVSCSQYPIKCFNG